MTYNPFRYRSYMYDTESGFYYLQSRYYDPVTRRFINSDGYVSTGKGLLGYNMFTYCNNNPVMYRDPTGEFLLLITIVVAVIYYTSNSTQNDKTFSNIDEATKDWSDTFKSKSETKEKGAILYEITDEETNETRYTYGRTYNGFEDNTIPGFIIGYISGGFSSLCDSNKKMVGFIHSHPATDPGYHNDFPSEADLFLFNLPGMSEIYIVSWDTCSGMPSIIKSSDEEIWKHNGVN